MTGLFRALILLTAVLLVLTYWGPYVPDLDDREFWDLMLRDGQRASLPEMPAVYWALGGAWLFVLAGLDFYVAIARPALFVLLLALACIAPFEGTRVVHPMDAFIGSFLYPIQGALLVMAYFTSVSRNFAARHVADGVQT